MSNVLLVSLPPWGVDSPPLALACLSSFLNKNKVETKCFDFNIKLYNAVNSKYHYLWSMQYSHLWRDQFVFNQIREVLRKEIDLIILSIINHPAKYVGFSLPTNCSDAFLQVIVEQLRKSSPGKIIILGGVSVSIKAQRDHLLARLKNDVDYCIVGQGEETFLKLILALESNPKNSKLSLPGVLTKLDLYKNVNVQICDNLTDFPFPDFDDFDLTEYTAFGSLVMEFSRGCVGRCPFCDFKSVSPKLRYKSARYIVDQIKLYKSKYDVNHLSVCDAAVNSNVKILEEVCDLLIAENIRINISALAIPRKEMTARLLQKVKSAGFIRLEYGVETGSDKVLKGMRKIFTAVEAETVVKATHAAGIKTVVYLIVGFPGETEKDIQLTKKFLIKTAEHISLIKSVNPLFIMAGSDLYEQSKKYGICLPDQNADSDWTFGSRNNRQIREQRVVEIKRTIDELAIPVTEEAECGHFSNKELDKENCKFKDIQSCDVLLLNLPWRDGERRGVRAGSRWPHLKDVTENSYLPFPFFLAQAASLLKTNNINVSFIDAIAEDYSNTEMFEIIEFAEPKYIVVETSTITMEVDLSFVKYLPERMKVIFVGPEAHINSEDFLLNNRRIDFTIKGEYEFPLLHLIQALKDKTDLKDVRGIAYLDGEEPVINEFAGICEIDSLPWPDRDSTPLNKYNDTPGEIPMPSVQMLASRGCPFGCIFCLWPSVMYGGRNYRSRNYIDVVDEMEAMVRRGFKSIYFDDDTFGLNKDWVINFSEEIIKRNKEGRINIPWAMMTRADCMDVEMLTKMKEAGLYALKYGVETVSPDLLAVSGKGYDRARLEYIISQTQRLGIKMHLTFTIGLPGETHRSAKDTIYYAINLNPTSVQFSVTTPFPGTPYYEIAKERGLLVSEDWSKYDGNHYSVVKTDFLKPEELVQYKDKAYFFWGLFSKFRNANALLFYLVRIYIRLKLLDKVHLNMLFRHWLRFKVGWLFSVIKFVKNVGAPLKQRLRYLGVFHGEKAFIGPQLIQIDPTNDCNNDCIGCWCNSPLLGERRLSEEEKQKHIPIAKFREIVADAYEMGTREIYLAGGGEPFMYRDIMDALRFIKEREMLVYINTNFTLLDDARIREIVDMGIEHLTVSIWAGTPSVYHATHPNKGPETFIKLENMLKYLQSLKTKLGQAPFVKIYNVISKLNYHELDYMYDFAIRTQSESVEFTVLDTIPGKTDQLMLDKDEMKKLYRDAKKLEERYCELKNTGQFAPILFRFEQFMRRISDDDCVDGNYDKNIIDEIPCTIGWNFARIVANGDVNGCLKAHRIPVGNINNERFKDIWNSKKQKYFRVKTNTKEKKDPFFSMIGNDPDAEVGCYKGCDDLGRNEYLHKEIKGLFFLERWVLKGIANLIKFFEKIGNNSNLMDGNFKVPRLPGCFTSRNDKSHSEELCDVRIKSCSRERRAKFKAFEINTKEARLERDKQLALENDLELRGILHGFKAYKGPVHVVLDLTNRCNNSCVACWMYSPLLKEQKVSPSLGSQELSKENVIKLINEFADMGVEIIRFTGGGEPLLHNDFSELVFFAKAKGLRVAVTTSLSYMTDDKKEALKVVDELAVSVWAADEKMYRKMHPNQKEKQFKVIEKFIIDFVQNKDTHQKITIANVLTNINYIQVSEMIEWAKELKVDEVYFTIVDPISEKTDKLLLKEKERLWLIEFFDSLNIAILDGLVLTNLDGLKKRLVDSALVKNGNYDAKTIDDIACYMGWHFSRILANGDVAPCCRGVKKIVGNINEKSFAEIWNGLKQQEFRNNCIRLSKFDEYFEDIKCYKTCDNLMQNRMIHERLARK